MSAKQSAKISSKMVSAFSCWCSLNKSLIGGSGGAFVGTEVDERQVSATAQELTNVHRKSNSKSELASNIQTPAIFLQLSADFVPRLGVVHAWR